MDLVLSLGNVSPAERRRRLVAAADAIVSTLHARFPAAEGYVHVEEPPPVTPARAFRRGIRVIRGARWGLAIDLETTDGSMAEARLTAVADSALALYLAAGGFIAGVALSVGYAFATGHAEGRAVKGAIAAGFALGAVLGAIGWLLARPFEGLKAPQVKEILEAMAERARDALGG
jgi:hypothetical protein